MSITSRNTTIWLMLISLLCCLTDVVSAQATTLLGMGYRNFDHFTGRKYLSLMGGAKMFTKADGDGFGDDAGSNKLIFQNYQVAGWPEQMVGLSRDDQFYSAPSEGKLAFTTPSIMELVANDPNVAANLPTGWFGESIDMWVSVMNAVTQERMYCSTESNCELRYAREYTPVITDIVPNQMYKDQQVDWYINTQKVQSKDVTPVGRLPMEELSFDGVLNNWEETIFDTTRLSHWRDDNLRAIVGDQKPSKSSQPRARFITGDSAFRTTSKHCNFAGDECWNVRTHAKIDSISANQGNTNGGQELTIKGWGFENGADITVAGVACQVTSATMEEVKCITGESLTESVDGVAQQGQPGIVRRKYDPADSGQSVNFDHLTSDPPRWPMVDESLQLVFEQPSDYSYKVGQIWDGYFKAPTTGEYRFYVSCDDACQLRLDQVPLSQSSVATPQTIAIRWWHTSWRNYIDPPLIDDQNQYQSEWIMLTQGELYRIDAIHTQGSGEQHFTASVEIKAPGLNGHQMGTKETQVLKIDQENQAETWEVIVVNPSNGAFYLVFQDPDTLELIKTDDVMRADDSEWSFNKKIYEPYYKKHAKSSTTTTKTSYDENGVETSDPALVHTVKYRVEVNKRMSTPSFASIQLLKDPANTSQMSLVKPTDIGGAASSAPLSGSYIINCPNPLDPTVIAQTQEIAWNSWAPSIEHRIQIDIPFLQSRIQVKDLSVAGQPYWDNARRFAIIFEGMDMDMPQCYLTSGVNSPLTGQNPFFEETTIREFGSSVMFEPIPLEMLYTAATRPQVLVNVEGMPAACANNNCDYLYVNSNALITSQSLSGRTLTISGTNLPTSLIDVRLGDVGCGPTTGTTTLIECTLLKGPAAGTYAKVDVQSADGLVPVDLAAVSPIFVPLSGVSIFPNTSLNQAGGDELTITATEGLPQTEEQMDVTFADGSKCTVTSASDTEATCVTDGFDQATIDTVNPYTVSVAVNTETDSTQQITLSTNVLQVVSLTPNSVSPVLKQDLTITFDPTFPDITASLADYKVFVRSASNYERELNIVSFDNASKQMIVKFNGAPSDDYVVYVQGPSGFVGGPILTLTTIIQVDTIQPLQGSVLGGTLLTITGSHYGTVPSDNPVKVGDNYCLVEETSEFEIKCRIAISSPTVASTADVIVFAKTYEEMQCNINAGAGCVFDYVDSTSTVTGITSSFDAAMNSIMVTVTGTGFTLDDTVNTELWIDGMKQETVSVAVDSATFKLTGANSNSSTDIKFYIAEGSPAGSLDYVSFQQGLLSISPSTGSSGGTLITVTGVGFGPENQDSVNLYHVQSTQNICSSVEVTGYGTFTCQTIAQEISSADDLKVVVNGVQAACLNTNMPSDCQYAQERASSPTLSSVTMGDASTINLSGTNFPTAGYTVSCSYMGVEGTVTSSTATDATCTFAAGVPAGDAAEAQLVFTDVNGVELTSDANGQALTNTLSIGAGATGLSCSFAGGCVYTVDGNGIAGAIQGNDSNMITVCGNECALDLTASTAGQAACRLPPLATSYSAGTFDIALPQTLDNLTWTGTGLDLGALNDGVNARDSQDNTSSGCYAQVTARTGYTFAIDQVKIFLNNLLDKSPYTDGNLVLQGSNDSGASFTDIHAYDDDIHEGWNALDYRSSPQVYSTIRLQGAVAGSCRIGEVTLVGVEVLNDSNPSATCTAEITIDGNTSTLTDVTYSGAITPSLTEKTGVMPRFGSVLGGESVTFSGVGFSGTATVLIDNRPCSVTSQTATEITCTTSNKPFVAGEQPSLYIEIDTVGAVATRGLVYRYVSRWSDKETWGNDIPPLEGEAVEIPAGQHLLVDVQRVPKLEFVLVYGSLIFEPNENDPNDHKTFDAGYIMVHGGYLEIGTEDFPYTSKLTITMHGDKADPYLPVYGNKVIAVRYGQLEMHGQPRSHVWTDLHQTANIGDTSITLSDVGGIDLDWQVGDKIAIASTDYDGTHSEVRVITGVTNRALTPVITFDEQPLMYKHFAEEVDLAGTDTIVMRAEVGLLSRNVVFRGDPETSQTNQYGAHIMLHSPGDESVVGRIENCEFTDVGQAFMLGRYPIHFHMIGTVQKSYIRKNSIHQTYNRGTTLHGVHYLEVSGNVYHRAMGHTVFIEDAIETKNLIENNLVIDTRESNSLLNTDQTPACFWVTHPDNIFRGNHCAGSKRYGMWFDLQTTSIGPSFDPNVCPENAKLGEFSDNVFHSCGRYGLRIFHNMIPRTFPCRSFTADMTNPSDPYHLNPVIPAKFYRLTSYKNGRNGAIAERVGAVEFHEFKTADNKLAGIEFSLTEDVIDGYAKIVDAVLVGRTANGGAEIEAESPHGIIAPRTENFTIDGARFYNYDFAQAAALGDCSHCFHGASTDSGARTYTTSRLDFFNVVRKIKYQYPWRGIFHDLDGTLTDKGPDTYATANMRHVYQPECDLDDLTYNGVVCDSTVQIRRVAFTGYKPDHFRGQNINIYPFDKTDIDLMSDTDLDAFIADTSNRSEIFWKEKLKPNNGWAVPYVTGHRYRVTWANDLDYTRMNVQVSERWQPADKEVIFMLPFVDAREAINVTRTDTGEQIMDQTMLSSRSTWISGSNWLQNDTDIRQFQFVVNGVDQTLKNLRLEGLQCIHGDCPQDAIKPVPLGDAKYWSDLGTWPSGQLPQEGEDVHIEPGMNVILDIETPKLNLLIINGRLSFLDYTDPIHLHAKQIYIRAGELLVGSETEPFQADAQISLYGMRNEQTEIMSGSVITGNKVIYNTGTLSMHGMPRDRHSRMRMSVYKDMTMALVDPGLDWVAGEKVYFAPTNHQWTHSEYKTIDSYNVNTGELFLTTPFEFYHFGQDQSTAADYNGVDTRGEVRLLTRNVRVVGADEGDKWGGNIFTNDRMEFDGTFRQGTTQLDYVEVAQCSQENTYNAAIRFESTGETGLSYIKNTVVHNSQAWSLLIDSSKNILVQDSDFIGAKAVGVNLKSISNVKMDGLFVADVMKRVWQGGDKTVDKEACVAYCSYWEPNRCFDNQLTNSIAAGCAFAGFVAPGHDCDDNDSMIFRNNVAHSGERVGGHIYPNPALAQSGTCYKGSHFSAYKNRDGGLQTMYKTMEMRMHDMTFIDNEKGVGLQISGETEYNRISMYDVEIYGEDNNSDVPDGQSMYCKDKYGLMLFGGARGSKPLHPTMASSLPIHKIKSYASWGTEVVLSRVNFNNFQSEVTRKCGRKHSAMQRNPTAADYIPTHLFQYTKFTDVSETAVIWMEDPNPAWANPTDCIEWPCTAPENVVLKFEGTTYGGVTQPLNTASNFQIVSDAEEAVRAYSNCQLRDYWSAAWCNNRNLGVLLFESLDADTEDRSIQPVVITNSVTGYSNALNSFMDHMWDGFYTGQKRLSRFPSQIEALGDYTMEFTGTPANNMRFTLKADVGGIKIKIPYPNAGSYTVFADGVEMPYTPWDKELGRHAELTKTKGCGENRYVGVENFLEFYIMPECEIKIVPRDAIMVSVRLDWTLDEFYSADGVDNFVDRMAAVLDVHASQIKVVAVYEGSVIIEYFVETLPDDEEPEKTLNEAQLKFYDAVLSGELDLGAPVIDAMASGQVIKTDYSGDHYQGKDGNIWDHLIDNNNQNGGNNSSGGDGSSNNNGSSDTNGSSDQTGDQGQQDGTSGQIDEQNFSKVTTETTIVTEEESPAMTETFKYLIVFLAVLSVALLIVIGYIAMRMCTKRRMKPINLARRASQPNQDFQYAGDDTKDIFSDRKRRKRKVNDADEHQVRQSETPVSSDRLAPPQTAVMTDSASNGGETNRALQTASR